MRTRSRSDSTGPNRSSGGGLELKPRRLVIHGLRSYRDRTEIDFSEASLFAIVGDTGAGKSSILEAIVFALYSAATWTRQAGDLISDGMRTMTVEMQFEVDGRDWLVKRSMSRDAYPPPIHHLSAVDDPTERYDQRASVDAAVEKLLGLSFEAFTSAVILPQGRFERLLTETPANRTNILKGIFRLEQLDEARELAKTTAEHYRPALERLRNDRAALLPNPREAAMEAKARLAAAEERIAELSGIDADIANIERRTARAPSRDPGPRCGGRPTCAPPERRSIPLSVPGSRSFGPNSTSKPPDSPKRRRTPLPPKQPRARPSRRRGNRASTRPRWRGIGQPSIMRRLPPRSCAGVGRISPRKRQRLAEAEAGREAEDEMLASLADRSSEANRGRKSR